MRLLLLFILMSNLVLAQTSNWANAGITSDLGTIRTICVDSINDVMYVAGNTYINGNVDYTRILYYQNGVWDTLPGYFNNIILSMKMLDNELYIGGSFDYVNSIETGGIVKWDGSNWITIGTKIEGSIYNIEKINDTLYVMGIFIKNGMNCIAKWNGNNWENVYDIPVLTPDSLFCFIYDAEIYNNEFYVCGNFNGDTIEDLIKYNGEQWVSAGDEIKGWNSQITNLEIFNGELYISGIINNGGGTFGKVILAKYNGQNWSKVGLGFNGVNTYIRDIKVFNNKMYICGNFDYAGDVPINDFAIWNGNKWCGLGGNFQYETNTLSFYHDTLFVSCVDSVDNVEVNGLARWIGGNYIDTCSTSQNVFEIENERDNIVIYPNPTSENFKIKFHTKIDNLTVSIYSINGRKIYEIKFINIENEVKINNLKAEKGLYFVRIRTDEFIDVKKLILN